ncbi:unnamed protein product [Adineta ricciae]|uniref:Peptidase C14A caspase catalytic domain-containing protein n=1 Tax=Adineta ricciae TaxID=249248 RepID=A0A814I2H0_ADIRI|nr:unnamed protein product [Adineta ricciae]
MARAEYRNDSRRKLALIIGNGDYVMGRSLFNTTNDAKRMTNVLKHLGFVIHGGEPKLNVTFDEFAVTLTSFICSIGPNDLVLFYYSGHGIQWEDQNYLIPVDNFKEENNRRVELSGIDLKRHAINAQTFLNTLDDRDPFAILFFLDCCRTYHLRHEELRKNRSKGDLSTHFQGLRLMPLKIGSLIAFACAPGTTADDGNSEEKNGLFTKHLLRHLSTSEEDIFGILTNVTKGVVEESNKHQIPHVTFSLTEKIFLFNEKQKSKFNKWKQKGTTVAGGYGKGHELNQLWHPIGIFIGKRLNLFIADYHNHRIIRWKPNESQGTIVAGGKGMNQLNCPTYVIVDEENDSLIIADNGNKRVVRWWNENEQEVLIDNIQCCRLTMDRDGLLYVSDWNKHEVRRWKIGEKGRGKVVAGGNGEGDQLNQLNSPGFIFVDDEESVYVSDYENHRVMKWRKGAKEGIVVAGGNGCGNHPNQLNGPQGICVDKFGCIYVADWGNDRIMRWCKGDREGEIIVGGNESNQLCFPMDISFDVKGNLYVTNYGDHRITRFDLYS